MDMKKLHQFAEKYYRLYCDPSTRERDVFDSFAEECFAFGLKVDNGVSFIEAYSQEAADDYRAFEDEYETINDVHLLATCIFSKWRHITYWLESSLLEEKYRKWFVIAFKRLCEITECFCSRELSKTCSC